jgi:hypothetical protein
MIEDKGINQKQIRNLIVGLGLGLALTALLRYGYDRFSGADYSKLLTQEWKTERFGTPFIQIETPVELKSTDKQMPEEAEEFAESQQSFYYQAGHDLSITITIVKYHPDVYFNPVGTEESIKNFERLFGAKNITYNKQDITINSYKSKRLDGSFDIADRQYDFTRISIESGQVVRDLLVIVKHADQDGLKIKKRLVDSIKVE